MEMYLYTDMNHDGESWSLHTFKESYLYYEDGTYKEYGAVVLKDEDNYHDGNMQTSFSELEITYPEVEH